ncbi:hypothetical protein [Botrimarina sp.]|uniref:hypothetical protein n=1 Tax=Botrimarina sp. TaxID=2795802 RepID=UPI0032F03F7B
MKRNLQRLFSAGAAALAVLVGPIAHAAPIIYENPILIPDTTGADAVVGTGLVTPRGVLDPTAWDFWLLVGNAGDRVEVSVDRIDSALDPIFSIWDAVEFDTNAFTDIFSNSANATLLATGDDEVPNPGPFGDPLATVTFTAPALYIIAVADVGDASNANPPTPELRYQINVRSVPIPEPVGAALAALAVGGLAIVRRR